MVDGVDQARFDRLRYVELKHGRIAMMAIVGHMVTTAGARLNGMESVPAGLAALKAVPNEVYLQMVATFALLEIFIMKDVKGTGDTPGDFRNGIPWKDSDDLKKEKLSIEVR